MIHSRNLGLAVAFFVLSACSGSILSVSEGPDDDVGVAVADASTDATRLPSNHTPDASEPDPADADPDPTDAAAEADSDAHSEPDAASACGAPLLQCGEECIDAHTDPRHCGDCVTSCAAGSVCNSGSCQLACPPNTSNCDGACVVLDADPRHCGTCETTCASADELCVQGVCRMIGPGPVECTPPRRLCSALCIDAAIDNAHCGQCGRVCAGDRLCQSGVCGCMGGKADCGGVCKSTTEDPNNCGACGKTCGFFEVCSNSACTCAPGNVTCDGVCTNPTLDDTNCGACGRVCGDDQVCTQGACVQAVGQWSSFQANSQHTGTTSLETATPPAVARWTIRVSDARLHGVALSGKRIYVSSEGRFGDTLPMDARSASNGRLLWTQNFAQAFSVGWPAVYDGVVYIQQNKGTQSATQLWALDAVHGTTRWIAPFATQWDDFMAPVVGDGRVFIQGGYYGGIYGFQVATGTQQFFTPLAQIHRWNTAYADGVVYSLAQRKLAAHDPVTGAITWSWTSPSAGTAQDTGPVLADGRAFVALPGEITALDLATHQVLWRTSGGYMNSPAVTSSLVLGGDGTLLRAFDPTTGVEAWRTDVGTKIKYPPIVGAGYAYVAGPSKVVAVSLATRAVVWQADVGGWLALGAGRLIVASEDGTLTGFVLTP